MIDLKGFQDKLVKDVEKSLLISDKNKFVIKAPTGSGKTIMLLKIMEDMIDNFEEDLAFVWLTPGAGDLEEQSYNSMQNLLPNLDSYLLSDAISNGFEKESFYFINWEKIKGKNTNATKEDAEYANLYQRINEFHRNGNRFILIIDEEDKGDTEKAQDIIDKFNPKKIIRASATANKTSDCEFFEVNIDDAIESGLLTKKLYINYDVPENEDIGSEVDFLIKKAVEKQKECKKEYESLGLDINPLVVIQFPNNSNDYIDSVRERLKDYDYSIENGTVANWLTESHINTENIINNNSEVTFVLTKIAISTGWNCPRAKILIKLRENTTESSTIQAVGRIRRTAEGKHYNNEILDNSYIYTTDKKYVEAVKKGTPYVVERMNLHLKKEFKNIILVKEYKNNDFVGTEEVCEKIKKFFVDKYGLTKKYSENKEKLTNNNYNFSSKVEWSSIKGVLDKTTENVTSDDNLGTLKLRMTANTTANGFQMTDAVRELKPSTLLSEQEIRAILQNLFCHNGIEKYRILDLPNNDMLYAFTINNIELLKSDIDELKSNNPFELNLLNVLKVEKENNWSILENDNLAFSLDVENPIELKKNVYAGYDTRFISTNAKIRWLTEHEFEKYIENCKDVKWIYKNGDGGKEYFSIVYFDGFYNQREFYPDYILVLKDDSIMVVEAKGGEFGGENRNIDRTAKLKFSALKYYASKHNIKWAFVRYYENDGLRFNNTDWSEKMGKDTEWKPIEELFNTNKAKIIKPNIFNKKLAASIDIGRVGDILGKDE